VCDAVIKIPREGKGRKQYWLQEGKMSTEREWEGKQKGKSDKRITETKARQKETILEQERK
jgi:hypothetical protein